VKNLCQDKNSHSGNAEMPIASSACLVAIFYFMTEPLLIRGSRCNHTSAIWQNRSRTSPREM